MAKIVRIDDDVFRIIPEDACEFNAINTLEMNKQIQLVIDIIRNKTGTLFLPDWLDYIDARDVKTECGLLDAYRFVFKRTILKDEKILSDLKTWQPEIYSKISEDLENG
jgi:hypothetical protein